MHDWSFTFICFCYASVKPIIIVPRVELLHIRIKGTDKATCSSRLTEKLVLWRHRWMRFLSWIASDVLSGWWMENWQVHAEVDDAQPVEGGGHQSNLRKHERNMKRPRTLRLWVDSTNYWVTVELIIQNNRKNEQHSHRHCLNKNISSAVLHVHSLGGQLIELFHWQGWDEWGLCVCVQCGAYSSRKIIFINRAGS